jgi:dolichol-phosphate hexosyltransferase
MSSIQYPENWQAAWDSSPPCRQLDMRSDNPAAGAQSALAGLPDRRFLLEVSEAKVREATADRRPRLKVSILMSAFNEQETIGHAVREVLGQEYPCEIELIVVDDGSSDATPDIAAHIKDPRVIFHQHPENRGKGAALRTAASLASGTYILPFDADLEYSAKDIIRLIEPIFTGRFEVVYGARLFGYNTVYRSFRYAIGNKLLTTTANMLFDSYLSDMHTCLKLIPMALFRRLTLRENGFGLDTEITATLLRLGIRPFEVPVTYYSRSHAEGKKINWRDALACLRILLRVRATRKRRLALAKSEEDSAVETQLGSSGERINQHVGLAPFDYGDVPQYHVDERFGFELHGVGNGSDKLCRWLRLRP